MKITLEIEKTKKKQPKTNNAKKTLIRRIETFIDKHFTLFTILLAICVVAAPFGARWCSLRFGTNTKITADGLLNYLGTVFSGILTFFLACVAIYQSQKSAKFEELLNRQARLQEICPHLQIELKKKDGTEGNVFDLTVENISPNPAIGVYIFEYSAFSHITGNGKSERKVAFGDAKSTILSIDECYYELNESHYPQYIILIFCDIDNNIIQQEFVCTSDLIYEPKDIEYI